MKDAVDADKQQEMGDRISKGVFTLRDMYEQFQVSVGFIDCLHILLCSF
jgi:signal recognition particle GTPase